MRTPTLLALTCAIACAEPDPYATPNCTTEIAYDGVDQDCDGADLVDVDQDGAIASQAGGDDCNDDDRTILPGAEDQPYDGVDQDCGGEDDYDVDRDGYVPDIHPQSREPFDPPYDGDLPGGDCDDTNGSVHPGRLASEDQAYDGVDLNCDCANDYDADGDGVMHNQAANEAAASVFAERYGCDLSSDTWGDCDDTDPLQLAWSLEQLGNAVDEDCDGEADRTPFTGDDSSFWEAVQGVAAGGSPDHSVVVVTSYAWYANGGSSYWPTVVLDLDPRGEILAYRELAVESGGSRTSAIDIAASDTHIYVGTGITDNSSPDYSEEWLEVASLNAQTLAPGPVFSTPPLVDTGLVDADLQVSTTGTLFAGACGTGHVGYLALTESSGVPGLVDSGASDAFGGTPCTLDLDPSDDGAATLYVQPTTGDPKPLGLGSSTVVDLDPGDTSTDRYEDTELALAHEKDGVTAVYDQASGVASVIDADGTWNTLLTDVQVFDIEAVAVDGGLVAVAVTEDRDADGHRDLWLFYGSGGSWTERKLMPGPTADHEPVRASIGVGASLIVTAYVSTALAVEDLRWAQFAPSLAP